MFQSVSYYYLKLIIYLFHTAGSPYVKFYVLVLYSQLDHIEAHVTLQTHMHGQEGVCVWLCVYVCVIM